MNAHIVDASDSNQGTAHSEPERLDKLGIAASLACAVHCMLTPFLLLLLPAAGAFWSHPLTHWILAVLVLPLALMVILRGYRVHGRRSALIAAVLGALFIVAGLILPEMEGQAIAAGMSGASASGVAGDLEQSVVAGEDSSASCSSPCCPSVSIDQATGEASVYIPAGSVTTLIGSVLLVMAHMVNLHGCRCFHRGVARKEGGCGCPTTNVNASV